MHKYKTMDEMIGKNRIISVIVPVYNVEGFLHRCVDSILNQTFTRFELILIDDGSVDASASICDSYKYDERVRVIHQHNQGVSKARNIGLKYANGEYITFVDGDDYLETDALDILYTYAGNGYDLVCGSFRRVSSTNCLYEKKLERLSVSSSQLAWLCYGMNFDVILGGVCGKLYRNQIIRDNNISFPEAISLSEDNIFNICYYELIEKAILLDSVIYNYFYNEKSLTTTFVSKIFEDTLHVYKARESYFFKLLLDRFNINNFANQYIILFCYTLRTMARQYNYFDFKSTLQDLLNNNDIKRYIFYGKLSHKLTFQHNIFIIILKLRHIWLIWQTLTLINNIADNRFYRTLIKK